MQMFVNVTFFRYCVSMDNNNAASPSSGSHSGRFKVNYKLLPVKCHYFFFMACKCTRSIPYFRFIL
jgi:hypothetical protein